MTRGLSLTQVSVRYRAGPQIIDTIDVHFPRKVVTAVVGPNGAGKSTLLRGLVGLLPLSGQVVLDGESLVQLSRQARARKLAYVPQKSLLQARVSVEDVIRQGRFAHRSAWGGVSAADEAAVDFAIEQVSASDLAGRWFDELSAGQQQRVLIARALATGATTLLLDEPTAALDARHVLVLHGLLRDLAERDFCIVAVMHGLDEVYRHADRVLLLCEGRAQTWGTASEVLSAGPIRDIYKVELGPFEGLQVHLPSRKRT